MAAKIPPYHRKTGDALGNPCDVVKVRLTCSSCGSSDSAELEAEGSINQLRRLVSCRDCGRLGRMRMAKRKVEAA